MKHVVITLFWWIAYIAVLTLPSDLCPLIDVINHQLQDAWRQYSIERNDETFCWKAFFVAFTSDFIGPFLLNSELDIKGLGVAP